MGLPVSMILIAVGAILTWAVNKSPSGINIHVVGVILMIVGLVGFLLSLVWWDRWGGGYWRRGYAAGPGVAPRARYGRRATVVEDEVAAPAPPAAPPPPGPPADPPPY
jgi:hypothetical protein